MNNEDKIEKSIELSKKIIDVIDNNHIGVVINTLTSILTMCIENNIPKSHQEEIIYTICEKLKSILDVYANIR